MFIEVIMLDIEIKLRFQKGQVLNLCSKRTTTLEKLAYWFFYFKV
jgi:hypothetical protein